MHVDLLIDAVCPRRCILVYTAAWVRVALTLAIPSAKLRFPVHQTKVLH